MKSTSPTFRLSFPSAQGHSCPKPCLHFVVEPDAFLVWLRPLLPLIALVQRWPIAGLLPTRRSHTERPRLWNHWRFDNTNYLSRSPNFCGETRSSRAPIDTNCPHNQFYGLSYTHTHTPSYGTTIQDICVCSNFTAIQSQILSGKAHRAADSGLLREKA